MIGTVVYIDLVILSTLAVNYLFLKAISILIKQKITFIRLVISLMISVFSLFLFIAPIKFIYNVRYFIGLLIGVIAFKQSKYKLYAVSLMYILNLSLIGTLVIFNIDSIVLLLVVTVLIVILEGINIYMPRIIKSSILEYNDLYKVEIGSIILNGFLDTGNSSNYLGIPIIYIPTKYLNDEFAYFLDYEVKLITGIEMIKLYTGPNLIINSKSYQCVYVFSKEIDNVILNINFGE